MSKAKARGLLPGAKRVRDSNERDVDSETNRVAVGKGSAYDLFLSRELKRARIVHAPTSPTVVQTFVEQGLEVAAGDKQKNAGAAIA